MTHHKPTHFASVKGQINWAIAWDRKADKLAERIKAATSLEMRGALRRQWDHARQIADAHGRHAADMVGADPG